ncbi:hypothetical protein EXS70_03980, partial [Candidatus Peribacteria bacterium]|nr:hypothetical protein [Candidatus Peribacteria bacterium]
MSVLQRLRGHSFFVLYVFVVFFVVGILVHRDYGVSGDEAAVRKFGIDAFNYLFGGGKIPTQTDWGFFNPVVTMFMRAMELLFGLKDGADIWFLRHFITFLMFFGTVVTFYAIAKKRFCDWPAGRNSPAASGGWKLPLLGSVMFIVSPRLFAHGFYNPKDIPSLFFFSLSAWTLLWFLEKKTVPRLLIHILITALLISMRVFGLMMPVLAMIFLWTSPSISRPRMAALSSIYFLALALFLALTWPMLWHDPVHGLVNAFLNTTGRAGGGFYFGQSLSGDAMPWHYLPVWIGITTPVIYSLFFLIGSITLWIRCMRNPMRLFQDTQSTGLALAWFTLPVAALVLLNIGIFDEWRHVLFLYPAFLLIALEGIEWSMFALKKFFGKNAQWIVPALLTIQIASTGFWMVRNHPFEYAYFSIPTRFIAGNFDLDYWGLSYRAGLQLVAEMDSYEHINIFTSSRVGKTGADTLPYDDWNRLYFTTPVEADYILDNFRVHDYEHRFPESQKIHSVIVDGLEILAVYKGPDTQK